MDYQGIQAQRDSMSSVMLSDWPYLLPSLLQLTGVGTWALALEMEATWLVKLSETCSKAMSSVE